MRLVGSCPTFSPLPPMPNKKDVHYETKSIFKIGGGYFLLHVQALADFYLLGSGVPCVARTFLSLFSEGDRPAASRPTAFWGAKVRKKFKV